jgi:hypothetical protein
VGKSGKSGFNQFRDALRNLFPEKAKAELPTGERKSERGAKPRPPISWKIDQRLSSTPRSAPLTRPAFDAGPGATAPKSKPNISKPPPSVSSQRGTTKPTVKVPCEPRPSSAPAHARTTPLASPVDLGIVSVHHSLSGGRTKSKIAPWVAKGQHLQLDDAATVARTVRIGLDFGTSFTKMAVGIGDDTWVIDWRGLCDSDDPCLVPSEASVLANGQFVVGQGSYPVKSRGGIKLPMLAALGSRSKEQISEDDRWVAAFLTVCLQYARAWIYKNLGGLLRRNRIMWEVNLGIPVGSWDLDKELESRYHRLATLAWQLSRKETIVLPSALPPTPAPRSAKLTEGLQALNVVPEIVAQVAGYFESTQRKEGMHILMDIGGGTLDLACFYTHPHHSDDKHVLPIYSTEVRSFGTTFLVRNRFAKQPGVVARFHAADKVLDRAAFAEKYDIPIKTVEVADAAVRRAVSAMVIAVAADGQSWNQSAPEFTLTGKREPLRVFITGGGAKSYPYRDALGDAFKERRLPAPTIMELVTRDSVNWPTDADVGIVDRMSVAIGLTRDIEDLRLLSPKALTPVIPEPKIDRKSSDEIYAK